MNWGALPASALEHLPLVVNGLRVSAILAIGWAVWRIARIAMLPLNRLRRTSWWDLSARPDGALGWSEVLRLIKYEEVGGAHQGEDPLAFSPTSRGDRSAFTYWLLTCALLTGTGLAGVALAAFVLDPFIPAVFDYGKQGPSNANAVVNLSGNLTALLALVAASISIAFTYHQLQAKVRADNRQEWLAVVRSTLARTLALATRHAREELPGNRARIWRDLDPERLKLELLLNPSEKDHRLLMLLIQRLAFIRRDGFEDIADVREITASIKHSIRRELPSGNRSEEETVAAVERVYQVRWGPITERADIAELVTYAMRLSHVVLKREWERVKWTR